MPKGFKRAPVYDPNKGTVRIWSREGRVPGKVLDLIDGDVRREINSHSDKLGNPVDDTPGLVDYYATMRIPTVGDIRAAHRMGSEYGAIDIPAQGAWLRPRIAEAVNRGDDITIWIG